MFSYFQSGEWRGLFLCFWKLLCCFRQQNPFSTVKLMWMKMFCSLLKSWTSGQMKTLFGNVLVTLLNLVCLSFICLIDCLCSGETHKYTRVAGKSLHALNERCDYWNAPGNLVLFICVYISLVYNLSSLEDERTAIWDECAKAQAVASLFSNLNAQAHTQGIFEPNL